jgi:hypothetical protein
MCPNSVLSQFLTDLFRNDHHPWVHWVETKIPDFLLEKMEEHPLLTGHLLWSKSVGFMWHTVQIHVEINNGQTKNYNLILSNCVWLVQVSIEMLVAIKMAMMAAHLRHVTKVQ